jgi:hypothetical protein
MKDGEMYRYPAHSRAHQQRAATALQLFDTADDVQQLFVAALELRLGIEARLFEYIRSALPSEIRDEKLATISTSSATWLLAFLTGLNESARTETTVVMTSEQTGHATAFRYTPVTQSLAKIHGRLGEILHWNYFAKNPHWFLPHRLHARDLIAQGLEELGAATSGTLLSHPTFKSRVDELLNRAPDETEE